MSCEADVENPLYRDPTLVWVRALPWAVTTVPGCPEKSCKLFSSQLAANCARAPLVLPDRYTAAAAATYNPANWDEMWRHPIFVKWFNTTNKMPRDIRCLSNAHSDLCHFSEKLIGWGSTHGGKNNLSYSLSAKWDEQITWICNEESHSLQQRTVLHCCALESWAAKKAQICFESKCKKALITTWSSPHTVLLHAILGSTIQFFAIASEALHTAQWRAEHSGSPTFVSATPELATLPCLRKYISP